MRPKRFFMVMTARSGSTWLITLLNGQPGVAAYEELLMPHPVDPRYAWLAADAPERLIARRHALPRARPLRLNSYLHEVEAHRRDAVAAGFKINAVQFRATPELLPILALRGYRLVVLVRDNVFESSISQIMSAITGEAHSREAGVRAPVRVDPAEVVDRIRRRLRWIAAIRGLRRVWPCASTEVTYEELVTDQMAALARILRAIGVDAAPVPIDSPLKRRVDRPYDEVITNFAEVKKRLGEAGLAHHLPQGALG